MLAVHDFIAWASQFLRSSLLGLLVFPSRSSPVEPFGMAIELLAHLHRAPRRGRALLARSGNSREIAHIAGSACAGRADQNSGPTGSWSGAKARTHSQPIVFFVVVVSVLMQGTTARWARTSSARGDERAAARRGSKIVLAAETPAAADFVFIRPEAAWRATARQMPLNCSGAGDRARGARPTQCCRPKGL